MPTATTADLVRAILGDGGRLLALTFGPPDLARRALVDAAPALPEQVRAGLYLACDCFDESHAISQDLDTPDGSYWHAILHRREPDAFNAKYWFARVGPHRIFPALAAAAHSWDAAFDPHHWDPRRFVDLCEQHRGRGTDQERTLQRIQAHEIQLLLRDF
jgi:hypothetical protein